MGRPWIKLSTRTFDDEKIKLIKGMPNGSVIINIWIELICLAGKLDTDGVFMLTEAVPYTDEMFASIFQENILSVRLALKTFLNFGMMEKIEGAYALSNWSKYQSDTDAIETARKKKSERQRRWREKQKNLLLQGTFKKRDVSETSTEPSVGAEETPLEKEEEVVDKEKDIYSSSSCSSPKQRKVKDGHSAVSDFYTKNIRPTPSEYELNCLLDLADEYSDEWTIEALKETIKGGGRGLRYTEKILERWKAEGYKSRPAGKKHSGPSTQSQETIDQANEIPF